MVAATMTMWYALLTHDFSVSYVAQVGSLATPAHIAIFSLWSSLEGSILFWGFVLALYTAGFAYLQRRGHEDYLAYSLGVIFCVGAFFSYMLAGPSNPFLATPLPIPTDGPGPNSLLQNHILMAVHPPTLYLGYVGMTIPFAMGMAALLRGQLGPTWLLPMRNWLLLPTAFLTMAIMLGGWWAYEVLGWGGYWAWDPVENASFLPWLTAVAAIHSAMVQQRRGTLKAWTTILILVTFLLTILGTFLTRAGVIASVHSFTQSPIGPLFLIFLCICLLAVVIVLSLRIDTLQSEPGKQGTWSREGAFLVNNLLLVGITFTVLVGTLYPILAEAVRGTKVTVGEPWFNRYSLPMFLALVFLVGVGPALPWGRGSTKTVQRALITPLAGAAIGTALAAIFGVRDLYLLFTCGVIGYSLWVTFAQISLPTRIRRKRGESAATAGGQVGAPLPTPSRCLPGPSGPASDRRRSRHLVDFSDQQRSDPGGRAVDVDQRLRADLSRHRVDPGIPTWCSKRRRWRSRRRKDAGATRSFPQHLSDAARAAGQPLGTQYGLPRSLPDPAKHRWRRSRHSRHRHSGGLLGLDRPDGDVPGNPAVPHSSTSGQGGLGGCSSV